MWLEALDLVLARLRDAAGAGVLARVRAVSGSCQQHGGVFWAEGAERRLAGLNDDEEEGDNEEHHKSLADRLAGADVLAHPFAPNWQDSSTQAECDEFERAVGGAARLAEITGSSAHHVRRRRKEETLPREDALADIRGTACLPTPSPSASRARRSCACARRAPRRTPRRGASRSCRRSSRRCSSGRTRRSTPATPAA
jgi:hypothetical protein